MCGILATGTNRRSQFGEGLRRLEYQYDSIGVAVDDGETIQTHKTVGKVSDLKSILPASIDETLVSLTPAGPPTVG